MDDSFIASVRAELGDEVADRLYSIIPNWTAVSELYLTVQLNDLMVDEFGWTEDKARRYFLAAEPL